MNNTDIPVPPAKQDVTSPYDTVLTKAGYSKDGDLDSDEDDFLIVAP
jgi:hypothetical protein